MSNYIFLQGNTIVALVEVRPGLYLTFHAFTPLSSRLQTPRSIRTSAMPASKGLVFLMLSRRSLVIVRGAICDGDVLVCAAIDLINAHHSVSDGEITGPFPASAFFLVGVLGTFGR